ncbi:hypothetical protein ONS95_011774 [Cadophora gregata]|uniref:uncharacterized protein n=1 Tax=Cadophora gregata TaxID=51156 RepID=UPI0026DA807E|nr:uncharacterized protein ONS95_011774 [Cadophora gregata]KAK0120371.1 hypothetical protein ONS95_011774 [Cadophora gregata]
MPDVPHGAGAPLPAEVDTFFTRIATHLGGTTSDTSPDLIIKDALSAIQAALSSSSTKQIPVPAEVFSFFHRVAILLLNTTDTKVFTFLHHVATHRSGTTESSVDSIIQLALSATFAALAYTESLAHQTTEEILRLQALVNELKRSNNSVVKELGIVKSELEAKELEALEEKKKTEEERNSQKKALESEKKRGRDLKSQVDESKRDLAECRDYQTAARFEKEAEFNALVLKLSQTEIAVQDLKAEYDKSNIITRADCQKLSEEKDRVNKERMEDLQADIKVLESKLEKTEKSGIKAAVVSQQREEKLKQFEEKVTELQHAFETVQADGAAKGLITQEECSAQNNSAIEKLEGEIRRLKSEAKNYAEASEKAWKYAADEETKRKEIQGQLQALKAEKDLLAEKAESLTREAASKNLRKEVENLKEEVENVNHDPKQTAELKEAAQETTAVDSNSISVEDCESQKTVFGETLEIEKHALQSEIADLKVKPNAYEDADTISRRNYNEEKSRESSEVRHQIEPLQTHNQEAENHGRALEDRIQQCEETNRDLRDKIKSLQSELQAYHESRRRPATPPTATLKERIAALDARVTEVNKVVESQAAELSKRGISSNVQQMRHLDLKNGRLIEEVARLEDALQKARNRKVASPYTSFDEKDAKIEELTRGVGYLNESVDYHFRQANLINIQYGRLLGKKTKLEERLKKMEEKVENMKKGSSKRARKDRAKKGIEINMPAQAAARQAGNISSPTTVER